ncbi:MAG: acyl-CoA dehydrogenase family protein, partial [Hyphomonadaceae bacterium]
LLKYGTEEQRERFLRPGIECEQIWCMLFSEGTGGSDLAGLRTTARREGDHYVVNGRKMWNGGADFADIGVLMTRTDPAAPKHRGLSQFLVDMKSPGISVNPIIDMTGAKNECNEVLFEDVIVPADRLIGAEGQGWEIVRSQLQTERALMGKGGVLWGAGPTTRDMIDGMIKTGRIANPRFRDTAAKLFVEGEILRLLSYRALSDRINGKPAGPEAALAKVTAAPHGQRVAALVKHSQGASGMIADKEALPLPEKPHPREDVGKHWQNTAHWNSWDHAFWFSPAVTLGVGTQEVLKNVIAEQILELPRDIDPTAGVPFNETNKPSLRAVG